MTLLIHRVNSLNFLLFLFLSLFYKIEAYEIRPFLGRFRSKRLKLLEWDRYFLSDDIIYHRSEALKAWEKIITKFPSKPWQLKYDNLLIDFSKKAKQELGASFEHLFLFREIQRKARSSSKIYIVNSREFLYINKIAGAETFIYDTARIISKINVFSDALYQYSSLIARIASLCYLTIKSLFKKYTYEKKLQPPVKYLWDAVNPNEIRHFSIGMRYFPWIVDGDCINHRDVVFLVPRSEDKIMREIKASPYQAFTISELYQMLPGKILRTHLVKSFRLFPYLLWLSIFKVENLIKSLYVSQLFLYEPLVKYLKPACYITSMSSTGNENAALEYFNVLRIKTVMYCYSANAHLFTCEGNHTDFRTIQNSNIMSSCMVVWHEQFKKYIESHPQQNLEVKVIGPLMAGQEGVFQDTDSLRQIYISKNKCHMKDNIRYLTVFDESSATKQWKIKNLTCDVYPNPYDDEYCTAFMKDMYRLLMDLENIALLFKPQRNLFNKKFSYSPELIEILENIKINDRGIILDDDINPWIPIALADLCIGIPFTSPVMAAWHHGKAAIFHDPTGITKHHRYQAVADYISHSYEQLRSKVNEILFKAVGNTRNYDPWLPARTGFTGRYPGQNSSDEFRKYLNSLCSIK